MKKGFKYFGIFLAFILIFTGCGKKNDANENSSDAKDARTKLEEAIKKTSELESVHEKVYFETSFLDEGVDTKLSLSLDSDTIQKNDTYKNALTYNLNLSGMNIEGKAYLDLSKTNISIYSEIAGRWYKYVTDIDPAMLNELTQALEQQTKGKDVDSIKEVLDNVKSINEVESDKEGYTKIELVIDKDKANAALKEGYVQASKEQGEDVDIKDLKDAFDKDLVFNLYLKDGYIAYFELDLTDYINAFIKFADLEDDDIKAMNIKAKMTYEYTNFNSVNDFEVPEDVKNSASKIEQLIEEYMNDFEEVISEVMDEELLEGVMSDVTNNETVKQDNVQG